MLFKVMRNSEFLQDLQKLFTLTMQNAKHFISNWIPDLELSFVLYKKLMFYQFSISSLILCNTVPSLRPAVTTKQKCNNIDGQVTDIETKPEKISVSFQSSSTREQTFLEGRVKGALIETLKNVSSFFLPMEKGLKNP